MFNKIGILIFILFSFKVLMAQESRIFSLDSIRQPKLMMKMSVMQPGLLFEVKINNQTSINLKCLAEVLVKTKYRKGNPVYDGLEFYPRIELEPRFYTNFLKRLSKGKKTYPYSGAYFSIPVSYIPVYNQFSIGPVYGIQRIFGKRWFFDLAGGLGIYFRNNKTTGSLIGNMGFGYILY